MLTILLVQSDGDAREVSAEWFRQAGFFVLECASGEEALSLVMIYRREIDLVVTDRILLRMDGCRLVAELRKVRPGIRALVLSEETIHDYLDRREVTFFEPRGEFTEMIQLVRNIVQAR